MCDLAWITGKAENLVGHHLRTLRAAGLAGPRLDGKIVFYSLTDTGRTLLAAHLLATESMLRARRSPDAAHVTPCRGSRCTAER